MLQPLKTLIVEDNQYDIVLLEALLSEHKGVFSIEYKATTYASAVKALASQKFQLSILDFNLDDNKDLNDIIKDVGTENMGIIVLHSIDTDGSYEEIENLRDFIYLRKPFSDKAMPAFIRKVLTRASEKHIWGIRDDYNFSMEAKILKLKNEQILFVEVKDNYCEVHYLNKDNVEKNFLYRITLTELEEKLEPSIFVRCHNRYIINKNIVTGYSKRSKGGTLETNIISNNAYRTFNYSESFEENLKKLGIIGNEI